MHVLQRACNKLIFYIDNKEIEHQNRNLFLLQSMSHIRTIKSSTAVVLVFINKKSRKKIKNVILQATVFINTMEGGVVCFLIGLFFSA